MAMLIPTALCNKTPNREDQSYFCRSQAFSLDQRGQGVS